MESLGTESKSEGWSATLLAAILFVLEAGALAALLTALRKLGAFPVDKLLLTFTIKK
jgi:hypothetical protein